MGCVSSTFLEDDDRRIIGVSASHIVSLTSSTYGILTNLATDDPSSASTQTKSPPPPPPPPLPPPLSSIASSKAAPVPPAEAEVINSWELMAGLLDPSTPAKPKPGAKSASDRDIGGDRRPPRSILRSPLGPIDGNAAPARPPRQAKADPSPARCPPGGAHCAVLYTTTLRSVRATFEACNAARAALEAHGVAFRERDVSMDRGFREELHDLVRGMDLGASTAAVPRLFVRGRHVGGAEEVARLDEAGELAALLEGLPRARPGGGCCDGCGGMRFLACFECSGSRKVVVAGGVDLGARRKGRTGSRGLVVRCGECNENGLVLCPICS